MIQKWIILVASGVSVLFYVILKVKESTQKVQLPSTNFFLILGFFPFCLELFSSPMYAFVHLYVYFHIYEHNVQSWMHSVY